MNTSFVELNDDEDCRSSTESSIGFSFSSAMGLKKNLTETFDREVDASHHPSSKTSTDASSTALSVVDRIAQFEVAAALAAKPPRPLRPPSNVVPENRIAVYLRIRPPHQPRKGENTFSICNTVEVVSPDHPNIHPTKVRTYPPPASFAAHHHDNNDTAREYAFHQVLDAGTTQKSLYSVVSAPLIQSMFDSYASKGKPALRSNASALLFSYGITNSGKTHTILGDVKSKSEANWGVTPRAIADVFSRIKQLPRTAGKFDIYISVFEIYNENIYDLIPKKASKKEIGPTPSLKVRERQGQTVIRGLTRHRLKDTDHGIELLVAANSKRHTSSNNLNSGSSRSHCISQIQIVSQSSRAAGSRVKSNDDGSVASMNGYSTDEEASFFAQSMSTLWVVDLAGSERSKRTNLGIERQKEASLINKSLLTLMRCFTAMREAKRHSSSSIVPFRESKLTHIFMGHLSGPSSFRTVMVVNVNPAVADFDETQHVLSYASQTRLIRMDSGDLERRRKICYGNEYDMNGRKKAKVTSSSASLPGKKILSTLAKRLSPRKLVSKLSPRRNATVKAGKRKTGPLNGSHEEKSNREVYEASRNKRLKIPPSKSSDACLITDGTDSIDSLRKAVKEAQSEVQKVKAEKVELIEELRKQESYIRKEVSQEMEERLRVTRERNQLELEKLRSQMNLREVPCRSSRKARMDEAAKHVEELIDKVNECEDEMVRIRKAHSEEVAKLRSQVQNPAGDLEDQTEAPRINELERQLAAAKAQIAGLEKSKIELIETYEKLLGEQNDMDDLPSNMENKRPFLGALGPASKRNRAGPRSTGTSDAGTRDPLSTISRNTVGDNGSHRTHREAKGERWVFPTKPSARDETGSYRKPTGKAPMDRQWDSSVGAWRLNE